MGRMRAMGMAQQVRAGNVALEVALYDHLRFNHYPPMPTNLANACMKAIERADQGEWHARIEMPEGVLFRGSRFATAHQMVESCHLHEFLSPDEEYPQ